MRATLFFALFAAVHLVDAAAAADRIAVVASDFSTTAYVIGADGDAPWTVAPGPGEPVHHDAVARWHEGLLYVVNRGGADNLQVLDPERGFDTVRQVSLGLGRNIQDIGFASDGTAFVSCYDTTELLRIDPETGAIVDIITTAPFADADGLPETSAVLVAGDRVFVACQRLDRDAWYAPVGESYLLVYDSVAGAWLDCDDERPGTQGIRLAATNPYGAIASSAAGLHVACAGFYGLRDGGLDVVDPDALVSRGLEVAEADLGGDVVAVAATNDARYIIVTDGQWVTRIVRHEPGEPLAIVDVGTGYDHAHLAHDGECILFVADRRTGSSGLRAFDTCTGDELTAGAVDVGLPPAFIAVDRTHTVSVGDAMPAAPLTLAAPWPNPANPAVRFAFEACPGEAVGLRVLDVRGRIVRRGRPVADASGHGGWTFDGRDQDGRPVPSGVYRIEVRAPHARTGRTFTIVR